LLGTASQVPTRHRNHNGYLLRWDGVGFLFDPGEGTQRQMVIAGASATQIHHVLVTHFHGDHALGLAGVIQRLSLDRVPHEVCIHYPASGQAYFERLRYATIYHDQARIRPNPIYEPGEIARGPGWTLEAFRLDHPVETYGYRLVEDDGVRMDPERLRGAGVQGPVIGQLVRDGQVEIGGRVVTLAEVSDPRPGQRFAFVMDTRPCAGARRLADRADLLVCESTYLDAEEAEAREHHHMTARQAATLARDAGARRLVLCHFSQRYPDERGFLDEARPVHGDVIAARDFDRVSVPTRT
jgi:ribonuclease Z